MLGLVIEFIECSKLGRRVTVTGLLGLFLLGVLEGELGGCCRRLVPVRKGGMHGADGDEDEDGNR